MIWTIPNAITLLRFLGIPWLAILIVRDRMGPALVLFVAIALTDILDGWIARRFHQVSEFGKLFDPFVDKLFQFVTALLLWHVGRIPLWIPGFVLVRELLMIIGGAVMLRRHHMVVFSRWYGKLAAFIQVAFFGVVFLLPEGRPDLAGWIFLLPVVLSVYAYFRYYRDNVMPVVRKERNGSQNPADP